MMNVSLKLYDVVKGFVKFMLSCEARFGCCDFVCCVMFVGCCFVLFVLWMSVGICCDFLCMCDAVVICCESVGGSIANER